jgi:hypothetical protein
MAGKYGSASIAITYDDGPGGTARTITPYVTSISGIKVEQITEQTSPFGVAYETNTPVGKQRVPDITVEGYYDTTATSGPHVVFGSPDSDPNGSTRTFTFQPGDSKTFTMETRLVDYSVTAQNGNLSKYTATIRQAGAGAWT